MLDAKSSPQQICSNETAAPENKPCDPTIDECRCGVEFRAYTASCEKVTCSGLDYNSKLASSSTLSAARQSQKFHLLECDTDFTIETQELADELCAPLYSSSSLLGPSVTSAIASITSFAEAAVATRDAVNLETWPACGVRNL